ncbi:MAG: cellulase family glycosylhydrolase [Chloroflexota bacterium]
MNNNYFAFFGLWLLVLAVAVGATGCRQTAVSPPPSPPSPTPTLLPTDLMGPQPVEQLFPSPAYGMHTFLWWRPDIAQRDLQLVQAMGFSWVKQKFSWRDIEGAVKGQYDWYRPDLIVELTEAAGLELVIRLDQQPLWSVETLPPEQITAHQPPVDYQDFGDFCGAVADRFQGRIAAYQVWNEPNLSREWGEQSPDPVAYTELLRVCYEAIKTADPQAIVISAGLAPTGTQPPLAMPNMDFLQGMYDAGAAAYFDVLGVHAPGYSAPPDLPPGDAEVPVYGGGRWFAFRHVEDMRAIMVANGDGHKQVAILEMGWITDEDRGVVDGRSLQEFHESYAWHAVDEQTQADYLVGAYQYAREHWQPWIGLMATIYIADYDWTPEQHEQWWWAIVLPDGTPRAAYQALSEMEK